MYVENAATMTTYLNRLVEGGDFREVPMRDDVRFVGPLASASTAADYRTICAEFADAVRSIEIRTMVGDDEFVHVVYDVDMGLASGPLRTSQTVRFVDGEFASVEVIFDAAVVTGVAS